MPPKKSKNGSLAGGMTNPQLTSFIKNHELNKTDNDRMVGQYYKSKLVRDDLLKLLKMFPAGRELLKKPNVVMVNVKTNNDPFAVFNKKNNNKNNKKQSLGGLDPEEFGVNGPNNRGFTSLYKDPVRKANIGKISVPLKFRKSPKLMEKYLRSQVFPPYELNWRASARKRREELMKKPMKKPEPLVNFPKPNKNNGGVRIPTRPNRPFIASTRPRGVTKPKVAEMTRILERLDIKNKPRSRPVVRKKPDRKKLEKRIFGNSNSNSNSNSKSNSKSNRNSNSNSNSNSNRNNGYASNMSNSLLDILVKKKI